MAISAASRRISATSTAPATSTPPPRSRGKRTTAPTSCAADFRGGRVLKVEIEQVESAFLVNGDVQGTARRPYVAVLELLHDDSGFALLNDYCNCPLGGGCN